MYVPCFKISARRWETRGRRNSGHCRVRASRNGVSVERLNRHFTDQREWRDAVQVKRHYPLCARHRFEVFCLIFFARMAFERWSSVKELEILGSHELQRLPIFSFLIKHQETDLYLHYNFVTTLLNDLFGIQTRGGCACAGPYAQVSFKLPVKRILLCKLRSISVIMFRHWRNS